MLRKLIVALVIGVSVSLSGCKRLGHAARRPRIHTYHMSDGSIVYRGADSIWYWHFATNEIGAPWTRTSNGPETYVFRWSDLTITRETQESEADLIAETNVKQLPEEPAVGGL